MNSLEIFFISFPSVPSFALLLVAIFFTDPFHLMHFKENLQFSLISLVVGSKSPSKIKNICNFKGAKDFKEFADNGTNNNMGSNIYWGPNRDKKSSLTRPFSFSVFCIYCDGLIPSGMKNCDFVPPLPLGPCLRQIMTNYYDNKCTSLIFHISKNLLIGIVLRTSELYDIITKRANKAI